VTALVRQITMLSLPVLQEGPHPWGGAELVVPMNISLKLFLPTRSIAWIGDSMTTRDRRGSHLEGACVWAKHREG